MQSLTMERVSLNCVGIDENYLQLEPMSQSLNVINYEGRIGYGTRGWSDELEEVTSPTPHNYQYPMWL